jgi:hypothetical protein
MKEVVRFTECSSAIEMNVGIVFIRTTPEILGFFVDNRAFEIAKRSQTQRAISRGKGQPFY